MINCMKDRVSEQVNILLSRVLKDEYTVDNGLPPVANADGTGRIGQLMNIFDPRYHSSSLKDGLSKLYLTE